MIDYYKDGQFCDETKTGRNIEVHMQCCKEGKIKTDKKDSRSPDTASSSDPSVKDKYNNILQILEVSEPNVCSYKAVVCSDTMCPLSVIHTSSSEKSGHSASLSPQKTISSFQKKTISQVLRSLASASTCLYKQEDWWTYELCLNGQLRQYHVGIELTPLENGEYLQQQVSLAY